MDKLILDKIFQAADLAFAVFDNEFNLIEANRRFRLFFPEANHRSGQTLADIVPESVGLEPALEEAFLSGKKKIVLPFVNRNISPKTTVYFTFVFFVAKRPDKRLYCVIRNVTREAELEQALVQKERELVVLQTLLDGFSPTGRHSLLGNSPSIKKIRQTIEKVARIPTTTILLQGESGTGKNLVARSIHTLAAQKEAPFVEINCAAIPETLLESELFGYERGAFTNAFTSRKGLIETADGGTLFLDEIGELPLKIQAKLLSFMETRRFRRLGSNQEKEVRLRLIAATNRDLRKMVDEGKFREDLLFRLFIVSVDLPPLRELDNDIVLIARHFVEIYNRRFKKKVKGFTAAAENKLLRHNWPGNVRELSNVIERAMIFSEGKYLDEEDLLITQKPPVKKETQWQLPPQGLSLEELERNLIFSAMEQADGNKSKAARLLGLSRDALRYRLEKYTGR
ncbi:MAG TPA: sigma-54-dependent Fis family transcriptional regulator [Caldithrix abyssi]|uniref:Sigma-54-dependent Fis family transcriptional regulator n=1 Tax=Caldithrix abyssi TaxID=187145 RepID=A0A7V4U100_CALAY|nr:sigma-54-dependent Fis family transcriptional regulator [Caldithrix abyssi]